MRCNVPPRGVDALIHLALGESRAAPLSVTQPSSNPIRPQTACATARLLHSSSSLASPQTPGDTAPARASGVHAMADLLLVHDFRCPSAFTPRHSYERALLAVVATRLVAPNLYATRVGLDLISPAFLRQLPMPGMIQLERNAP
ncbi:MAG TPA: hypothetical protein VIN05_07250 [Roseovarius sp.]